MVRTPSTMPPLGMEAPSFSLPDVRTGGVVSRDDFRGRPGLLVMFICNHCPYVKHVRDALAEFGNEYGGRGLGIVAISSNDPAAYPDDAPERMREEAAATGYTFPYCFDETQEVAKAYDAACTPDFFLFDRDFRLAYCGQFDETRPNGGRAPTGRDLRAAAEAVLAGQRPAAEQIPSIGCIIKWRSGNQPGS